MGADQFMTTARGRTATEAFKSAVDDARHEHGHGGYTGSIAEKSRFVVIEKGEAAALAARLRAEAKKPDADAVEITSLAKSVEAGNPEALATALLELADRRVEDKWGPAGCIRISDDNWLFFGWASS